MRNLKLANKILMLALCTALAVPSAGLGWKPMRVEASSATNTAGKVGDEKKDGNTPNPEEDIKKVQADAIAEIEERYYSLKDSIPQEKKAALDKMLTDAKTVIANMKKVSEVKARAEKVKTNMSALESQDNGSQDQPPEEEPEPTTTNSNIMVGGNWVTPVANAGSHVNVVLPVVNMGRTRVKNVVVTPQISEDAAKWPFEIETSNYSQTIDRLPGTDDGGTDMERRRELTWTLKTRKDAPSGYMPLSFQVTFENDDKSLSNVTLTSYVKVVGTTGVSADGKASTPRVIVTGFSTNPEQVHAGETFTLTLHMQNTSKATAVKNMVFDIQAASESTDTTYVAAAFLPTAGSSTVFVDKIAAGASKDISMEMEARSDLAQKPYVVNVKMNYEDESVNAYENTASVSIPVRQEARVDASSIEVMPESIEVGSEANVMFSVYNIGKTKLYNTSVKFVADSVSGGDTYLGNIEPGATANVDAYLSGAAPTMDEGIVKIVITFEDEAGEATTIEKEMNLFVTEPFIPDDMGMGDMMDPGMEEQGGFKLWYILIPLAVIAVAVVVVIKILKKKKKKAHAQELQELEDDFPELEEVELSKEAEEQEISADEEEKE